MDAAEQIALIVDGRSTDLVARNLLSSDLDCDRLDYLIRDSVAAGLTYGEVDVAYLIENLVIAEHPSFGPVLAIDRAHGARAAEHYLVARYYHYAQFITHKTIVSAELLLAAGILELIRHGLLPSAEQVQASLLSDEFLSLSEARVWSLLHQARGTGVSPELEEIARRLIERDLLKSAYDLSGLESREAAASLWLDDLLTTPRAKVDFAAEAGVESEAFCYRKLSLPLVGVYARPAPEAEIEEAELRRWAKTAKVAEPFGEPEPLFETEGLVKDLAGRAWMTRRVLVREEPHAPKGQRKTVERLAAALSERAP